MRSWTKRGVIAATTAALALTSVGLMPDTASAATRHHYRHVRHYGGVNPLGAFAATIGTVAGIAAANSYHDDYYGGYGYGPRAYYGGYGGYGYAPRAYYGGPGCYRGW
jgi:hypothetical protein